MFRWLMVAVIVALIGPVRVHLRITPAVSVDLALEGGCR
jgi:hypothetical protein